MFNIATALNRQVMIVSKKAHIMKSSWNRYKQIKTCWKSNIFHSPSAKQPRYHNWKAHTDAIQQLTFGALDYGWNILLGHGRRPQWHCWIQSLQRSLELEKLWTLCCGPSIADWYRSWSYLSFSLLHMYFWFQVLLEVIQLFQILQKAWFGRVVCLQSTKRWKPIWEIDYAARFKQHDGWTCYLAMNKHSHWRCKRFFTWSLPWKSPQISQGVVSVFFALEPAHQGATTVP